MEKQIDSRLIDSTVNFLRKAVIAGIKNDRGNLKKFETGMDADGTNKKTKKETEKND